jgi:ubiquitin-conjugating enzyme E2 J2
MAIPAATNRLVREYKNIQANPPPFIVAHPSEANILEWHYILTGPPGTPYDGGQYWGTLMFPPDYPFAPPAIRMHTPSGRFQPSARLCLSISDFHPKSFNPAWEVSTILIGLMSFMTSEEMTTGGVRASDADRKVFAARTRWWNSTGGGTWTRSHALASGSQHPSAAFAAAIQNRSGAGVDAVRAGDGGSKFRAEWPELDLENWRHMLERRIDPATGSVANGAPGSCAPGADALRANLNSRQATVMEGAQVARNAGQGWLRRNKFWIIGGVVFLYILFARMVGDSATLNVSQGG